MELTIVDPQYAPNMLPLLRQYKQAKKDNLLLLLDFVTVHDYLFQLRLLAHCLQPLGSAALYYLAAAVSDFHIPPSRMSEHKIQSMGGGNALTIVMDPVPKFLHHLVQKWAPTATIISFKVILLHSEI
jgi:phosphopantothenate---cysteine ligase (ATP)